MKKIALAVVLAISLFSCKTEKEERMLKLNFEKGKSYEYEFVWDMKQEMMGRESDMTMLANFVMTVLDDDGKVKTIESTYDRFKMGFNMMGVKAEVDTDKPIATGGGDGADQSALMGRMFSGIKGKKFTMQVDDKGNLVSIGGVDALIRGMVDSSALDPQMKQQMEVTLKDQLGDQQMKDQFAPVFNIYPDKAVKVGDSWDKTYNLGGKMMSTFKNTYVVKEIKGDNVTLNVNTVISPTNGSEGASGAISGTQTGDMVVDSKTGLMTSGSFVQSITSKSADFTMNITSKGKIKGKSR